MPSFLPVLKAGLNLLLARDGRTDQEGELIGEGTELGAICLQKQRRREILSLRSRSGGAHVELKNVEELDRVCGHLHTLESSISNKRKSSGSEMDRSKVSE